MWANNILHRKIIASPKNKNYESCKVAGCKLRFYPSQEIMKWVCHNWCTLIYFILYEWLLFSYKFIIFLFFWGCKGTIFYPYLTYVNPIHRLKFSIKRHQLPQERVILSIKEYYYQSTLLIGWKIESILEHILFSKGKTDWSG